MKVVSVYKWILGTIVSALFTVIGLSIFVFYSTLDKSGVSSFNEKKIQREITSIWSVAKRATNEEDLSATERLLEGGGEKGTTIAMEKMKSQFKALHEHFRLHSVNALKNQVMAKKRDLMDSLVQGYRKEISSRNIPLRAAYLGLLGDLQASLVSETVESDKSFLKKGSEKLTAIRSASEGKGTDLALRIKNLDSQYHALEIAIQKESEWVSARSELVAAIDRALPTIYKDLPEAKNSVAETQQRNFIYLIGLSVVICFLSLITALIGNKLIKFRIESRASAFMQYMKKFGSDSKGNDENRALLLLNKDPDWKGILAHVKTLEESLIDANCGTQTVVEGLRLPCILIDNNETIRFCNDAALERFDLKRSEQAQWKLEDLLNEDRIKSYDGDSKAYISSLRNVLKLPREDQFECLIKTSSAWVSCEIMFNPVLSGRLAGGKIVLFREISNETARVEKALAKQTRKILDYAFKLSHRHPIDIVCDEFDAPQVKDTIAELEVLRLQIDEREMLWKSEIEGLFSQIDKQRVLLSGLKEEVTRLRRVNKDARLIFSQSHGEEEEWHVQISTLEKDIQRWMESREHLISGVKQHLQMMVRMKDYENFIGTMEGKLKSFGCELQVEMEKVISMFDRLNVLSLNLSIAANGPEEKAFSKQARVLLGQTETTVNQFRNWSAQLDALMVEQMGAGRFIELRPQVVDMKSLENLREEQETIKGFFERWHHKNVTKIESEDRINGLLGEVEEASSMISQLGEAGSLLNERTLGNLTRWN